MKILNLYAGIGGNRALWPAYHDVTSVELNPDVAAIYQDRFPGDKVVVGDAHDYLLHNYMMFDFIWSSPVCKSHSRMRKFSRVNSGRSAAIYPDFKLYEEIVFIGEHTDIPWVVENVVPYYKPLIPAQKMYRHLYWAPFTITDSGEPGKETLRSAQIPDLEGYFNVDLSKYKTPNKRELLRNMVHPLTGLSILNDGIKWAENNK